MDCRVARELLSATLDQEASLEEGRLANTHLGTCAACRSWWAEIGTVNRHLRVRPAETAPDLSTKVLARVSPPRPGRGDWIRYALGVVAATELALALPGVMLGQGAASIHDGRHIGTFGAAVAIGLLYVAWRPGRALGILPMVAALAVMMAATATIDLAAGRVRVLGEAHHLLEATGLALVWMLAGRPLPRRRRDRRWPTDIQKPPRVPGGLPATYAPTRTHPTRSATAPVDIAHEADLAVNPTIADDDQQRNDCENQMTTSTQLPCRVVLRDREPVGDATAYVRGFSS